MTIASEIQRIQTNIASAYDAAEAKGATLPAVENTENLASTIESIEAHAEPVLQDKVIVANGEYNADEGYYGLSKVTVNVVGTGAEVEGKNYTGAIINEGDKVWINPYYYEAGEEIYATAPRYSYSSTSSMNNGNYPPIPTPDFHYCFSNYSNYNFYSIIDNSQVGTSSYITSNWSWFRTIEYVNGIQYVFYGENSSGGMQRTDIGLSWSHAKWQPILGDPSFVIDWSGTEDILHKIDVDTGQIINSWNLGYKFTEVNSRARFLGFSVNQDQLVLATAANNSSNALFELNSDGSVTRTNLNVYCLTMDTFAQTSDKSQIIDINLQRVFDVSNLNDIKTISTPFILSSSTYPGWVNFHTNEDLLVVKKVNYASNKLDTYRYNISTKSWDLISLDFPGSTHNNIAIDVKGDLSSVLYCSSGSSVTNITLEEIGGNNLVNFNLVTANTQTGIATESIAAGSTGLVNVGAVIEPTGSITITENGTHNVADYAEAVVNVASGSGNIGIPREVKNGIYQKPTENFTFSLPSDATDVGENALNSAFAECTSLTSVDLSSLTTVSGFNGLDSAFAYCTALKSVDLSSLTTVSGKYGLSSVFGGCASLTSVDLSSLTTVGDRGLESTFYGCTGITDIYFRALTPSSFGSATNQFDYMMNKTGSTVTHTLHFPSNMESTISGLSGYPLFGGTSGKVVCLFDLPIPISHPDPDDPDPDDPEP